MSDHGDDYVYVIQHELGPVKIGRASEPRNRLSQIQIGSPFDLHLKKTRKPRSAARVEKALHRYFRAYHLRGEWFDIPKEYRDFEIPEKVGVDDIAGFEIELPENRDMNEEWARFFESSVHALQTTKSRTSELGYLREVWQHWGDLDNDDDGEEFQAPSEDPDLKELAEDIPTGMKRCSRCGHHYDQNEITCPMCAGESSDTLDDVW